MSENRGKIEVVGDDIVENAGEINEYTPRILTVLNRIFIGVAIFTTLFHIYTSVTNTFSQTMVRSGHVALMLGIGFLCYPMRKYKKTKKFSMAGTILSIIFAIVGFACNAYIFVLDQELIFFLGMPTTFQVVIGIIDIILILECCRRYAGLALPVIASIALLYTRFGAYMPQVISHKGYDLGRIVSTMYISSDGIFGSPISVSASFVMLFVIFGSAMQASGSGDVFIDMVTGWFGKYRGGPAKMAVVSSCLFGSISGSSVANVVSTGSFTIPLMKSRGYSPKFAGAVEAVASTGGQIMPPIMGSVAFLIAEFLGISYSDVVIAAFIPAMLYYIGLFLMVDFEAAKLNLPRLTKEETPNVKQVLKNNGHLLLPLLVLLANLLVFKMTPIRSAFWSLISMMVVAMLKRSTWWDRKKLINIATDSCNSMIQIALACATAGIVIGAFGLTGLGLRFSGMIVALSGGNMLVLLILCMIACIILGMGLPSVGVYIILAVLVAPALIDMGVSKLAAHMYLFHFGNLAAITPPVAMAAYAAAAISGETPWRVGWCACRLGLVAFLIPFAFVANPALLMQGPVLEVIWCTSTALVGTIVLAISLQGYPLKGKFKMFSRVVLFVAAICMVDPNIVTDIIGIGLIIVGVIIEMIGRRNIINEISS